MSGTRNSYKFTAATWRLTLWYLTVLMAISICFSLALYHVSSNEIDNGFQKEFGIFRRYQVHSPIQDLNDAREEALDISNAHLRANLCFYNLIILAVGGVGSYWFARRTLRPIQQSLESQSRFTADASHELRTPLTAMRSEIEVALRDKQLALGDAKELLKSNLEEVDKLEALSASLLTLAHYDEGTAATNFTTVAVSEVAKKAVAHARKMVKPGGPALRTVIAPVSLRADRASLQELLAILLDNALKYSPDGGEVVIKVEKLAQEARIIVQDHGVGMKAEDIPHIFERFYRADLSRTKHAIQGYGLGLSIAKSIVSLHRGRIDVESKPGEGSTFTVTLPLENTTTTAPL